MHDAHGIVITTIARFDALDVFFQVELQMDFPERLGPGESRFSGIEELSVAGKQLAGAARTGSRCVAGASEVGLRPFRDVIAHGLQIARPIILGAILAAVVELGP